MTKPSRAAGLSWAWLFTALAALGLAAILSVVAGLIASAAAGADLPEGTWGWVWIAGGWFGLLAAALFGSLAVVTSRASGRGRPLVRIALAILAVVLVSLALLYLLQGGILGWLMLLAVPPALYVFWRRGSRTGDER